MGVRNWLRNHEMSDPVAASYLLTACSGNDGNASNETCRMQGVVTGPGVGPVAVEHRCMAPSKRWPWPGQTLPVTVDRADPTRLRVEWDQVPTSRDTGWQTAQDLAASMGGRPAGPGPNSGFDDVVAPPAPATSTVTYRVLGAADRALPGASGGGLTPELAADAAHNASLQRATARVLAVHDVDVPAGMPGGGAAATVDIILDVTPPSGEGWSTTTRIAFSTEQRRARVATIGVVLPVFVNPQAHDQIAIDTSGLF